MATRPGTPKQFEDHQRHMKLVVLAREATKRGQKLADEGRLSEAHAALEEAEAHMEQANLIAERWRD